CLLSAGRAVHEVGGVLGRMKRSAIRTGSQGVVARGLLAAWVLGGCGDDRVPSGSGGTESTAATDGSGSTAASTHETSSTGTTEADSSTVAEEGSSTGIP